MNQLRRIVRLKVNGHEHEVYVRHADTLLDVLREELGLTAAKRGCDLGTCGCCTVQIDGEPILSCLYLAAEAEGKEIVTVEALAGKERFSPLQRAWAEAGASQCGFCTPGFLMTADALLRSKADPSRQEIREALSGNLCRCTGFVKILDAVEQSAAKHREFQASENRSQTATEAGN
ncbi:MAG: (2Fe-2S)-binding protein [Planctomycetota bacterium]|nr:MAG: (2Fe-2S)-binding protein [Planctomycetota bacterium]